MNEYPKYILHQGTFNSMPRPYKEISEQEFWHQVLVWGFNRDQEFRQIIPSAEPELFEGMEHNEKYARNLHIFYYHKFAIGILQETVNSIPRPWKFLKIGCEHSGATGIDTIRGWHERDCPTCGLHWTWDSGD